jgi:hypothetical protein
MREICTSSLKRGRDIAREVRYAVLRHIRGNPESRSSELPLPLYPLYSTRRRHSCAKEGLRGANILAIPRHLYVLRSCPRRRPPPRIRANGVMECWSIGSIEPSPNYPGSGIRSAFERMSGFSLNISGILQNFRDIHPAGAAWEAS